MPGRCSTVAPTKGSYRQKQTLKITDNILDSQEVSYISSRRRLCRKIDTKHNARTMRKEAHSVSVSYERQNGRNDDNKRERTMQCNNNYNLGQWTALRHTNPESLADAKNGNDAIRVTTLHCRQCEIFWRLLIKGPEYDVFPDSSQHPMLRYPLQAQLFMTALNRYSSNVTTKMKQPSKQYVAPNLK